MNNSVPLYLQSLCYFLGTYQEIQRQILCVPYRIQFG